MSSVKNVAVAGPNGSLGPSVIRHLRDAGFDITLLTRDPEKASKAYPLPIKTVQAKYESAEELVAILRDGGFDAVVSLINRDQVEAQIKVIDAVAAARVPRFIPSAFGIGLTPHKVRELPVLRTKVETENHLVSTAQEGHFIWTAINTGMFLDMAMDRGILVNLKDDGRPTPVFDGGDTLLSVTTRDTIGKAVTAALQARYEDVRNRTLYIHDAVISQNQIIRYARELAPGREFKLVPVDSTELAEQGRERYERGERTPEVLRMFFPVATFGWGLGLFQHPDNELLGIKEWDEDRIKAMMKRVLDADQ